MKITWISCQIMNSLWCDEEPGCELPASLCQSSRDGSVFPSGPKDFPKDLIAPNAFTDNDVSP